MGHGKLTESIGVGRGIAYSTQYTREVLELGTLQD